MFDVVRDVWIGDVSILTQEYYYNKLNYGYVPANGKSIRKAVDMFPRT